MEDQKKKSIVYLLQGLVGNIRNKTNWQLQGYLHITLKSLGKVIYCTMCKNTHTLNTGPKYDTDFISDRLYKCYTSLNYRTSKSFSFFYSFFTCKVQTVTVSIICIPSDMLKTMKNTPAF